MEIVSITNGKRTIEVTQKAFNVVFKDRGYKLTKDTEPIEIELYGKTAAELEEIPVKLLKAFLDQEEIDYRARATKDELIALVIGDGVDGITGIENTSTDGTDGNGE
ncbi:hypothetical protein NSQ62_14430 [Solibacillus sp. FSL H8-0523]|uniref:hypothetical protein n=1 Tax=Solibacillus sp. FSL H8-0523 TaxID=2954511 RepID=UPI0031018DB6